MSSILTLSVALVTRNRPESLKQTLISLNTQSSQIYEILISDDSDDELSIIQNKLIAEEYNCTYLSGPQKGLYSNRNFVALQVKSTHFRTMDDDHTIPIGHINACLEAIYQEPESIWTIGEYYLWDEDHTIPVKRIPGQLHPRGYSYVPTDMDSYYGISCGATIYPRSVIDRHILNNEHFKFGIIFLEYGLRLNKNGYKIKHLNTTYIIHQVEKNDENISSLHTKSISKIYSILMLSFSYHPTFKNKFYTISQILLDILRKQYSFKTFLDTYKTFTKDIESARI